MGGTRTSWLGNTNNRNREHHGGANQCILVSLPIHHSSLAGHHFSISWRVGQQIKHYQYSETQLIQVIWNIRRVVDYIATVRLQQMILPIFTTPTPPTSY